MRSSKKSWHVNVGSFSIFYSCDTKPEAMRVAEYFRLIFPNEIVTVSCVCTF